MNGQPPGFLPIGKDTGIGGECHQSQWNSRGEGYLPKKEGGFLLGNEEIDCYLFIEKVRGVEISRYININ